MAAMKGEDDKWDSHSKTGFFFSFSHIGVKLKRLLRISLVQVWKDGGHNHGVRKTHGPTCLKLVGSGNTD